MMDDFNLAVTSPSTSYSGYSSTSAPIDPMSLIQTNTPGYPNPSMVMEDSWTLESLRSGRAQYQVEYDHAMSQQSHDGLTRTQNQQYQQYSNTWNDGNSASSDWPTQGASTTIAPATISPKVLTLNVPPAPLPSSRSSQDHVLAMSDSSSAASSREDTLDSSLETLKVVEPPLPVRQHRQILPDSLPRSRIVPVLPSNDFTSKKTTQKRALKLSLKSKPEKDSHRKPSSPALGKTTSAAASRTNSSSTRILPPRCTETKSTHAASSSRSSNSSHGSPTAQAEHHRNAKDDFLVRSKLAGMSYKDIRRHGHFSEAESTLRGRFRTLTKHKAARVRKPEWTDDDARVPSSCFGHSLTCMQVRLLKKAVRKLATGSDISRGKVPWKQVAEYIANNGGSYHFGNATCRKRWDDLPTKQRS